MSDVTLSKAIRSNLLHLQNTASLMDVTQERLATGKKVNSALDNPTNFFTASSLNARAADIATLLDAMSNGIQTIEMADHALSAITKNIESMQSALRQARQDKSFEVASYGVSLPAPPAGTETLSFTGGVLGTDTQSVDLTSARGVLTGGAAMDATFDFSAAQTLSFNIAVNGEAPVAITVDAAAITAAGGTPAAATTRADVLATINAQLSAADAGVTAELDASNQFVFTASESARTGTSDAAVEVSANGTPTYGLAALGLGTTTADTTGVTARSVDQLVNIINNNSDLRIAIRATNDNGKLRIENLSTSELTVEGLSNGEITGGANTATIEGNDRRANLARQYNELRTEIDGLVRDGSYNGVNLLRGDLLKIVFNEMGTSLIEIQTKNSKGDPRPIDAANLGLYQIEASDLDLDADIDTLLHGLQLALGEVRSQASDLGSVLSVVKNRENFTKQMINTLETGAANLTLADSNEEAANMLALQTRQQLSQTALSLANQADQAVLRLFG